MNENQIHLKIMEPEQIIAHEQVDKIIAEAVNGFFCLKPRHVDFASALKPGILYFYRGEEEKIMAVDRGILVKCGSEVLISVLNAIAGDDLGKLREQVREEFNRMAKTEEETTNALRNLEAELIQHFVGLQKDLELSS
ncbi:MAG: F0F1 ATP synthase subunit epsilon [Candidatus Halalkalibacterium sp. M3_1C_030]